MEACACEPSFVGCVAVPCPLETWIYGNARITTNQATNAGGAVFVTSSYVYVFDDASIAHSASPYGGGIFIVPLSGNLEYTGEDKVRG